MNKKEAPGAWLVVAVLFVSWFFVWGGGANTGAVFFPPLLQHFGWSRARLSSGIAASALSAGAFGLVVGWLLDRMDARKVMVAGVAHCRGRIHPYHPHAYLSPILFMQLAARSGLRRVHRHPVLTRARELVQRAARSRDGNRARGRIDRWRGDDAGRQLGDLRAWMESRLFPGRDADAPHHYSVANRIRAHAPCARG